MTPLSIIPLLFGLLLAPLSLGVINRTKALFAGRRGQPFLQSYHDLWKLLRKGAVYSHTTTWVFRLGPVGGLASVMLALAMVPLGGVPGMLAFPGDIIVFAGLLGLGRFLTILAALDTGSSFEGMGASREATFASLAEPVFYLALALLVQQTGSFSLSGIYAKLSIGTWAAAGPALALTAVTIFMVLLVENSRIPFDDPNTHLELTMIHEVMVLDHSGPDFAFIQYGAVLKHWIFAALLAGLLFPAHTGYAWLDIQAALAMVLGMVVVVGAVESCMARLRLLRLPQLLVGAGALSAMALILGLMR